MKKPINEIKRMQELAGIDDEQIDVLSSVLHFMPDEVVEAGENLEKELRKAGVKLETKGYLIDAIKDLVIAARHSK